MDKSFYDHKVYVFDLDGTLYEQPGLRAKMAAKLMGYYVLHPVRIGELILLKDFRKIKDGWDNTLTEINADNCGLGAVDASICDHMAGKRHSDPKKIKAVVKKWIYDEPLDILPKYKDRQLLKLMDLLSEKGKRVVIFSDYPSEAKMKALGARADACYNAADEQIGELKPSAKGLRVIMECEDASPDEVVMIGDRMEKDGQCAIAAGCRYVILPRKLKDRNDFYREMSL